MIENNERPFGEIIYHFDLRAHSLPLKHFIDTARASQAILDDFRDQVFGKKIQYELRVLPPEEGGFVEVLGLIILGGGGTVWGVLGTDIGKAYFKGLTGKEPGDWAEGLGEKHRKWLDRHKTPKIDSDQPTIIEPVIEGEILTDAERDAEALIEFLVSFLASKIDKLEQVGLTPEKFRKAFQARNAIYKACIDNPEIEGLAFDHSHDFPIKRSDFPQLITQIPDEIDDGDEEPTSWAIESVDIVVNSPNWKRDGRKWQAATNKYQDIAFSIEDNGFWHHVQIKDIQPDIQDNLRVQWAYPAGQSKPSKDVRVLRVLSYNGKKLSDPMTQTELDSELHEATVIETETRGLFDDMHDHHRNKKNEGDD